MQKFKKLFSTDYKLIVEKINEINPVKNNIPVTVVLGGGYSPDINTIVEAHCNTFRTAINLF
jgi:acetoin utilization deacetylase AcuC-like enzyme